VVWCANKQTYPDISRCRELTLSHPYPRSSVQCDSMMCVVTSLIGPNVSSSRRVPSTPRTYPSSPLSAQVDILHHLLSLPPSSKASTAAIALILSAFYQTVTVPVSYRWHWVLKTAFLRPRYHETTQPPWFELVASSEALVDPE
jgi:hypothetical protein